MDLDELKAFLLTTECPYLAADEDEWINADGDTLSLGDMDKDYLKNCYKTLVKEEGFIKNGSFLHNKEYDESKKDTIIEMTLELCHKKMTQVKKYM